GRYERKAGSGREPTARSLRYRLERRGDDTADGDHDADSLEGGRVLAAREPVGDGHDHAGRRDGPDDAHRADRERAVERTEPHRAHDPGEQPPGELCARRRLWLRDQRHDPDQQKSRQLRYEERPEELHASAPESAADSADSPGQARGEREGDPGQSGTGRVAATASSWFAWYRTAASAVGPPRTSCCKATACTSSAGAPSSSSSRSPRWTWPSRRPSSVGAKTGG